MSFELPTERVALVARPLSRRQRWPSRGALISVGVHAGIAIGLIAFVLWVPKPPTAEPDDQATIEIITGDNAKENGTPASQAAVDKRQPAPQAAAEPPVPQAPLEASPLQSPAPQATKAASPAPPTPSPQPPPDHAVAARANTAGDVPAEQPQAVTPPKAAAAAAKPSKPPAPPAPPAPPPSAPQIRLGDGIAAQSAEIENQPPPSSAEPDPSNTPPDYPIDAARRLQKGTVVLRVFIGETGYVDRVEIAESSGVASLDRSARDRIATWHYQPATRDGAPVGAVKYEVIRFVPEFRR